MLLLLVVLVVLVGVVVVSTSVSVCFRRLKLLVLNTVQSVSSPSPLYYGHLATDFSSAASDGRENLATVTPCSHMIRRLAHQGCP